MEEQTVVIGLSINYLSTEKSVSTVRTRVSSLQKRRAWNVTEAGCCSIEIAVCVCELST